MPSWVVKTINGSGSSLGGVVSMHVNSINVCGVLEEVGLEIEHSERAHRIEELHFYIGHHADCESLSAGQSICRRSLALCCCITFLE